MFSLCHIKTAQTALSGSSEPVIYLSRLCQTASSSSQTNKNTKFSSGTAAKRESKKDDFKSRISETSRL